MSMVLNTLRFICLSYPEVAESADAVGHISFKVRNSPFVMTDAAGDNVSIKVRKLTQTLLLEQDGYASAPHIGRHGWTIVPTDRGDGSYLRRLVHEAYSITAPQHLADQVVDRD